MKRKILVIISLLLLTSLYFVSPISPLYDNQNDIKKAKLKGNVKKISTVIYNAKDNYGNPVKGSRINKSSENDYDYSHWYDKEGKLYKSNYSKKLHRLNEIDEIHGRSFFPEETICRYYYDEDGLLTKKVCGKYVYKYIYEKYLLFWKQLSSKREYNQQGELSYTTDYKYDIFGNNISQYYSNYKTENYNGGYNPMAYISPKYFKYDLSHNLTKTEIPHSFGSKFNYFHYDSDNNLSTNGTKYEYDSTGNWIKRIEFKNNKVATKITERKITYW